MIVESAFGFDLVWGSAEFIRISLFTFVAFLSAIGISLTFLFRQLIVISFWDCIPLVTLFQIWHARRRRKPPDNISFSFRDATFRRLIVMSVSGSKSRGPKESPLGPSGFAQSIRIWLGRRRRKPPDKNVFPFRDLAFRRLIVAFISGSKPRGPKDSPLGPSTVAHLGSRTISDSAIEFARAIRSLLTLSSSSRTNCRLDSPNLRGGTIHHIIRRGWSNWRLSLSQRDRLASWRSKCHSLSHSTVPLASYFGENDRHLSARFCKYRN